MSGIRRERYDAATSQPERGVRPDSEYEPVLPESGGRRRFVIPLDSPPAKIAKIHT